MGRSLELSATGTVRATVIRFFDAWRAFDVARGNLARIAETADGWLALPVEDDWISALCVLPDGRLASGSYDRTIRLWDVTTGAETARLEGHSGLVSALCVLPDGRLASGSYDRTIRLWDVTTGAETARLEADAPFLCLTAPADLHLVAGDTLGRLHWLEVVVRSGSTHDKDSMGQRREARLGTVDRRHWHCMEETNAPPYEGIG
jgi:WD40 repeat protein